ncbi:MAG: TonB-dependent receptor [Bacteroidota bacterium]|nr:TonB-dependent receptor [Bacteroidota bacterium]
MKKISLFAFWMLMVFKTICAQDFKQSVKGTVLDKTLQTPIEGAVILLATDSSKFSTTNQNGEFEIKNLSVGRIKLVVRHTQYQEVVLSNLLLTSGKELVLNIQMEEQIQSISGVSVKSKFRKEKTVNNMSVVSARTFSVEETQKFAAAINDPARMATSFAGVVGADDGGNSIVIRGNSPSGMLWRMEGIDIPSPNHFASYNASGGGVSILSAQLMSNSDFMTGAFSAEYGNALSGVFDIKLRKGNAQKREYTLQAGFLGIDFAAEGPLSKKGGSFLVNYRYSTLGILNKIGINVGSGSNTFQDLSFNVHLPKNKSGQWSIFGFSGLSDSRQNAQKDSSLWKTLSDRSNFIYVTNTTAVGATHLLNIGKKTSLKNVLLYSNATIKDEVAQYKNDYATTFIQFNQKIGNNKMALNSTLNHKFSQKLHLRTGIIATHWTYQTYQKALDTNEILQTNLNQNGQTTYFQAYAQLRQRFSKRFSVIAGIHSLFLTLNNRYSIEPRMSAKYDFANNQSLSLGYGLHSQLQLPGIYFAQTNVGGNNILYPNKNLDFSKAHHLVLGYDKSFKNSSRIKTEAYYQHLFSIPIGAEMGSHLSTINETWGTITSPLVNKGIGMNYGLEITFEKFMHKGLYYLVSTSLYQSKFKAHQKEWLNTRFNGQHAVTFTSGKEIQLKNGKLLGFNIKTLWYGGYWETPINIEASKLNQRAVYFEDQPFSEKLDNYFRTDVKFSIRKNHLKYNSILSLDIQNVSNQKNIGGRYYDVEKQTITTWYQTPLIPVLSYKVEF